MRVLRSLAGRGLRQWGPRPAGHRHRRPAGLRPQRDGLQLDVVVFNDYQLPNAALAGGDLDANAFQHQPFLDNQNEARGFDIVPVGLTVTAPLGFYSRKIKSLDALPEGASVGIQNDPSNGNRALLLLQQAGLITLMPDAVIKESPQSPYANLIAVRKADQAKPWAKRLVAAYQSPEVKQFIDTRFNGAFVPAF